MHYYDRGDGTATCNACEELWMAEMAAWKRGDRESMPEADSTNKELALKYEEQIERGIELLKLCQKLQSEQDGVVRPDPFVIDNTKTLDQFAQDILAACTNMVALYKFVPMSQKLAELGRKLEADGKIKVDAGDDYSAVALAFVLAQNGIAPATTG